MPNFYCKFKLPWPFVAEDAFEMSFKLYKEYAQRVHRSTDLVGLRVFTAHRGLMAELLVKHSGSRGGGDCPRTYFRDIEQADIIVHASIFKWLCRDLTGIGKPRPVAAVSFRALLLRLSKRGDGQAALIEFGDKGEVIFRVGKGIGDQPAPVLHLCFPASDCTAGVGADKPAARIFCSCTAGNCQNCVCAKAGLNCTPLCHKKKTNSKCVRPPPAVDPVPTFAPGLLSVCKCPPVSPAVSLMAWVETYYARCADALRDPVVDLLRHCVRRWRSGHSRRKLVFLLRVAARATIREQRRLWLRVARARDKWRIHAPVSPGMRITRGGQKNTVVPKRKVAFYRSWCLRCWVEWYIGRRVRPDPLHLRFRIASAGI
jgi:hypothetical protein